VNRRHLNTLCLLAVLSLPSAGLAADPPNPLRVLSFNIRYANSSDKEGRSWTVRRDLAAQLIKEDQPDLIGYQEALRPMLDELGQKVPGYEEIGVGREDGQTKGEYSALWIRKERFTVQESGTFWLSDTPEIPNSMSWGNKITRICTWARLLDKPTGKVVHFYNVHLDHESQEARLKGTLQVLKHMEARTAATPWVLTGDFNAGEDNPVITSIKDSPLQGVDSWRLLHPDVPATESGTFHSFTGVRQEAKIDYVFVPKATTLIDAAILHNNRDGIYPSDHFPVRATVSFAP
jgi:endonuclease/exonuclease/phosphatase family metal-dependent hydrolase